MAWRLNRALTNWRAAVDRAYPNRDRTSDGTIGDAAHQQTSSDHNPDADGTVDAWDMDVNLRSADDRAAIEMLKRVFQAHPAARYWIHDRQIAHRNRGWVREPYTGSNPHTMHVHWNSNEATEDSTAPWNLEVDMANFEDRHATAIEYMDGRIEALAYGRDKVRSGLRGAGTDVWLVQELRRLGVQQRLSSEALLAAVRDDGDRDAIMAHVDQRTAELAAGQQALRAQLAAELAPMLAAALREELADLPAEQIEQATARALERVQVAIKVEAEPTS